MVVPQRHQRAVVVPVEKFLARVWPLPGKPVHDVVAVQMDLEGLLADLHTLEQLLFDIRHTRCRQERGQHVFVREEVVVDGPRRDDTGPADRAWHPITTFPVLVLFTAEWG